MLFNDKPIGAICEDHVRRVFLVMCLICIFVVSIHVEVSSYIIFLDEQRNVTGGGNS
jgi:hypothetical protein